MSDRPAPVDPHDRLRLERVRPPDWANPAPASRYNLVVLGAGTAGPIVGPKILDAYARYLTGLVALVSDPTDSERSLAGALAAFPLPDASIPPDIDPDTRAFLDGLHAFNVWRVLVEAQPSAAARAGS